MSSYPNDDDAATASVTIAPPESDWPESISREVIDKLEGFRSRLALRSDDHLGYPYNLDHGHHLGPLHDLLRFSINNLGDPFDASNYDVESRDFEVNVIHHYAKLWGATENDYWGCIAHSGTEGNRLCIEIASRSHPDGVVYFSDATHYSILGAANSFRLGAKCIPTQKSGEIDYDALTEALAEGKKKDLPAIITCNVGTTMTGAIDNVKRVTQIVTDLGYDLENKVYIHLDGALAGLMVPFIEDIPADVKPDFRHKLVASYSCSGHKFLGCPMPAGILVIRGKYTKSVHERIEYLNSEVVTSMGSRNGHAPVFLWYELQRKKNAGLAADVQKCLSNARYLVELMRDRRISSFLNPHSNTVVFERPSSMEFIKKYHLACTKISHVVVMPSVERTKLLEFVTEFEQLLNNAPDTGRPCLKELCGEGAVCFCDVHDGK